MRRTTRAGLLVSGVAAAAAAAALLLRARPFGAHPDAAHRPQPMAAAAPAGDELTEVKGIGPVYRDRLAAVGIEHLADLIEAGATAVAEAADVVEGAAADWIAQALALSGSR